MKAYCVTCKQKEEIEEEEEVIWKNGVKAVTGICSECGTKVSRILGRE